MTDNDSGRLSGVPDIHVCLYTGGAPILRPLGEYDIVPRNGKVCYDPCNAISTMVLHNLRIGVGFHWHDCVKAEFAGRFEVFRTSDGDWRTINILPVEEYLCSVTGSEMNPAAPEEFLKAHAVISRSWAMARIAGQSPKARIKTGGDDGKIFTPRHIITWEDTSDHEGFDVCSDDHCQRYQGLSGAPLGRIAARDAVDATRGLVLTDSDGNIADTRFSKCCGGHTELFSTCWQESDKPYLPAQPDPWCDLTDMTPEELDSFLTRSFRSYDRRAGGATGWECLVSGDDIAARLLATYSIDTGRITEMRAVRRGPSGRIAELQLTGERGSLILGKELAIRRLLDTNCLKSSLFDIETIPGGFRLHGRGWGHGAGLCQTGAARMAMAGKSFADILSFYYPGTTLTQLYD